ncbi:HNH endonuclease signature motif containing protein [Corynebacterium sp. MSK004]|uniref:HNH endonuclease signature motif containing protein n=1 Tax=Corynebacterium sp. MSK004 TaxID=3050186 RepID=UPI002550C079|nr:HNH endonuclease signature motif containing protein [Corynebacterium sp. MSK004]MDK8896958.1 HNH endonuclease signature motif containing protein [Corynebacterium sp. MSK004]
MNLVEAHLRSQAAGIELVAGVAGLSFEQLRAWGPESAARSLLALFDVYFASTSFTRKQARAVAAARANGHDLPTLLLIERFAGRLKKQRQAWDLRIELCGITGDEKAVARYARKRIRELSPPPTPKPGVTIRRGKELSKLTLTAPAALIEDLRPNIDEDDPVGSFTAAFREGRLARPVAQTLAVMELPEYATILGRLGDPSTPRPDSAAPAADGTPPLPPATTAPPTPRLNSTAASPSNVSDESASDEASGYAATATSDRVAPDLGDIVIQLSNGAKITGKELIERELAEEGLVMIVDRVKGPVELHRTQRVASEKQRIMACGEQPTCAWDRCLCGADYSQIHHITEWRHGGETNPENLSPLCKYHNAINGLPGRGRIVRENGKIKWVPAGPRDPREPAHPHRAPRAQRIREHRDGTASQSCTEPSARTPAAPPASTPSEPGSPAPPDR